MSALRQIELAEKDAGEGKMVGTNSTQLKAPTKAVPNSRIATTTTKLAVS
jgi:hypothetical protein